MRFENRQFSQFTRILNEISRYGASGQDLDSMLQMLLHQLSAAPLDCRLRPVDAMQKSTNTMWSDDLRTEIAEIDQQHKVLFDCLSRLEEAHEKQESWSELHFAIIEMKDYDRIHFTVEESIMRLCGYPLLAPHIDEHRKFEQKLTDMEMRSLHEDISDEMLSFLSDWLIEHIGKTDHQYVPYFQCARLRLGNE